MLTKREVQKIRSQMTDELGATLRTVVFSALMLVLIAGLAWFGAYGEEAVTAVAAPWPR